MVSPMFVWTNGEHTVYCALSLCLGSSGLDRLSKLVNCNWPGLNFTASSDSAAALADIDLFADDPRCRFTNCAFNSIIVRCAVVSRRGAEFSAGIDLTEAVFGAHTVLVGLFWSGVAGLTVLLLYDLCCSGKASLPATGEACTLGRMSDDATRSSVRTGRFAPHSLQKFESSLNT